MGVVLPGTIAANLILFSGYADEPFLDWRRKMGAPDQRCGKSLKMAIRKPGRWDELETGKTASRLAALGVEN